MKAGRYIFLLLKAPSQIRFKNLCIPILPFQLFAYFQSHLVHDGIIPSLDNIL